MKRTSLLLLLLSSLSLAAAGCNKPSDSACRQAITNMRSLMGTDSATANFDTEGDIRRCKGGSTKKAVECAGKATTLDELRACDFMKIPAKTTTDPGSAGSAGATGSAGSAGSAAPTGGSDMGSAGSAGSAAPAGSAGSAGPGSAAGSGSAAAAGSAATTGAGSADAPAAAGSGSGSAK